jgi:hypothetical protein
LLYAVPVMAIFLLSLRRRSASARSLSPTEKSSVPTPH